MEKNPELEFYLGEFLEVAILRTLGHVTRCQCENYSNVLRPASDAAVAGVPKTLLLMSCRVESKERPWELRERFAIVCPVFEKVWLAWLSPDSSSCLRLFVALNALCARVVRLSIQTPSLLSAKAVSRRKLGCMARVFRQQCR